MNRLLKTIAAAVLVALAGSASAATAVGKRTAALSSEAWTASEWISAADAPVAKGKAGETFLAADGASWFVTTVKNKKRLAKATWMTTALGVYDIYVNGQLVGDEILKPGFTHFAKTRRAFTYDITDALSRKANASNTLAAQVTPGWWADKIITPGDFEGMRGKKTAFRAVLELQYADGSRELIGTDLENWRAGIAGPVRHAAIFDGEDYDARERPGYEVVSALKAPERNQEFSGEILPSDGGEVYLRSDRALKPIKAYAWRDVTGAKPSDNKEEVEYGTVVARDLPLDAPMTIRAGETLVVDFGQNCAAVPSFVFKASEGTVLTCLPGELLNDGNGAERRGMDGPAGSVHRRNLRAAEKAMRLSYTFGTEKGFVSFTPRATFFGYRFVSITATKDVVVERIESVPVSSITREMEIGRITTGNEMVNRLISNTFWGQLSNYLSVPTDCPQRDERLGWTADTQVFTETGTFFADTDRFFHKWLRDLRDSQNELGGYPGVAPTAQYGAEMMRLGWADAGVIVPWTVWKQFGDTSIIEESWESMRRFITHVAETRYDHNLLTAENGNYQWADWLSYEALDCATNKPFESSQARRDAAVYWRFLGAAYWQSDAEMMADMARATGRDAAPFDKMAQEAKTYARDSFINADGTFKTAVLNTMQTPALFALRNGLVEGAARLAMIERLRSNFAEHGDCLQTGFLGTSILMETLTANGMSDLAYTLLLQHKNPSWFYSIDNGATTIWERWNSYRSDAGLGPVGMNSFNHYAYGCVCQWLWECAAGIAADKNTPGFRHIVMRPVPDRRLGSIDAEYRSKAGLIRSAWKYEGDVWTWTFFIPEGATASVTLPGETTAQEYGAGTYTIRRNIAP